MSQQFNQSNGAWRGVARHSNGSRVKPEAGESGFQQILVLRGQGPWSTKPGPQQSPPIGHNGLPMRRRTRANSANSPGTTSAHRFPPPIYGGYPRRKKSIHTAKRSVRERCSLGLSITCWLKTAYSGSLGTAVQQAPKLEKYGCRYSGGANNTTTICGIYVFRSRWVFFIFFMRHSMMWVWH